MHLPQIVADLKYRRKIAEKVFSANLRTLFDQRHLREKDDLTFSADSTCCRQNFIWIQGNHPGRYTFANCLRPSMKHL